MPPSKKASSAKKKAVGAKKAAPKRSAAKTTGKKAAAEGAAAKNAGTKKAGAARKTGARNASRAAGAAAPARNARRVIVPDTSVLIDGRLTHRIQEGEVRDARILIPNAAVAELEAQANRGKESGFAGLDEVVKIQELREAGGLEVEFVGQRPSREQFDMARSGEVDAIIRQVAVENRAKLLTSDRVQAHVARALGLDVEWIRPITEPEALTQDIESLGISEFFDEETMSVHLKQNVAPLAKKGKPGSMELVELSHRPMELRELTRMRREIIEAARRDENSFIEIERNGATVVQLGRMRIAIAQPPFSDAVEITAVRPVAKLELSDYDLQPELRERLRDHQRGVFVSGAPGSGKSTFVTAVAEWLQSQNTIVKTMESPRDLQVNDAITQYAPLDKDMALTSDVLLLVRPDFVVYDEVRRTSDFVTFADMRLAGVGLVGVTHANRAIDAIQRLIGRVELGMIPQVVDTVIHIEGGRVAQVLELAFTVKVPAGMTEADLARPVISVRDFVSKQASHEIYTYGEQVVVMPVGGEGGAGGAKRASGKERMAVQGLRNMVRRFVEGAFEVEVTGEDKATLYVPESQVPMVIGRGGANVKVIENATGMRVDVRPLAGRTSAPDWSPLGRKGSGGGGGGGGGGGSGGSAGGGGGGGGRGRFDPNRPLRRERGGYEDEEEEANEHSADGARGPSDRRYAEVRPELRKSKRNVVLLLRKEYAGEPVDVVVDDEPILRATVGSKGDVRIARDSEAGEVVMDALARGSIVMCRL